MSVLVLDGAHVVTMDGLGRELEAGDVVIDGSRIVAVGAGPFDAAAYDPASDLVAGGEPRIVDARGCVLTPGLVNTHHHLYQWATRGLAVDATLFEWLTALYPVWGGLDADIVGDAAAAGLGPARSATPTSPARSPPSSRPRWPRSCCR